MGNICDSDVGVGAAQYFHQIGDTVDGMVSDFESVVTTDHPLDPLETEVLVHSALGQAKDAQERVHALLVKAQNLGRLDAVLGTIFRRFSELVLYARAHGRASECTLPDELRHLRYTWQGFVGDALGLMDGVDMCARAWPGPRARNFGLSSRTRSRISCAGAGSLEKAPDAAFTQHHP